MLNETPRSGPNALRQLARNVLDLAAPRELFLTRGSPASRTVCLTFDDGPHPEHTPTLLDALSRERIRATFFVLGKAAFRYPLLVRRILAEGHAVGHHSYTHGEPAQTGPLTLATEVRRRAHLLRREGLRGSRLFRPPHGRVGLAKLALLWGMRKTVVLWNVDPRDWAAEAPEEVTSFFERRPLQGGDVVLLQDVCPWATHAIPLLARQAREAGLRFDTVDALIAERVPGP